jgi:hypothetical protein
LPTGSPLETIGSAIIDGDVLSHVWSIDAGSFLVISPVGAAVRSSRWFMTGLELEFVHETLVSCFDRDALERMLRFKLNKFLCRIVDCNQPFGHIVFELLELAEREGWEDALVARAAEAVAGRKDLQELARRYALRLAAQPAALARNDLLLSAYHESGLAPVGLPRPEQLGGLEKLIDPWNGMVNMPVWLERAIACQFPVCRVEIDNVPRGTGFLVGPSAVLTNHHVVAKAIKQSGSAGDENGELAGDVQFRFDYKLLRDGTILSGTRVKATALLDHSPAAPGELANDPRAAEANDNELDFALLEVEGRPGEDTVRVNGAAGGPRRGWIPVPAEGAVIEPDPYAADMPVLIVQHPLAQPLSLAIEWKSMLGFNGARTRVRHRTNTEAGSSGSPTFDRNWNLIALHHYGDPRPGEKPLFNQAVPIAAIRRRLAARGLERTLGGDVR